MFDMNQRADRNQQLRSWPKGIYAITLFEEDLAVARRFYQEVFDLAVVFEDANSCVYKIGGTLINLLKTSSAEVLVEPATVARRDAGPRLVFTIEVDDVDVICAALSNRGVTLLNGPLDRPWGVRTASFMDPGCHIWEIASPLAGKTEGF
jgi:catechol 2,3-dioxygenase-like lactoylglutathione lyase family enzyme